MASRAGSRGASGGPPPFRVGYGADVHPFKDGRRLVLGGVEIAHPRGLDGHSDADPLAHAVCDAILGALGLPDMGTRYPDTDAAHRNRPSLEFLRDVAREARARGCVIHNVDAVLFAAAPRLQPHLDPMRAAIAAALGLSPTAVGVKAKRCEGLGAIGRAEGIMAQAVVLIGTAPAGRAAGPRSRPPARGGVTRRAGSRR